VFAFRGFSLASVAGGVSHGPHALFPRLLQAVRAEQRPHPRARAWSHYRDQAPDLGLVVKHMQAKTPREVQEAEQAAAAASPSAHPSNSLSGASVPPLGIARLPRRRPPSGPQLGKSPLLLSTAFATASIQALPPRRSSFDLLSRQLPKMTSLPPDPRVNIGPTLALPTEEHRAVAQFSLNAWRVSACQQLAIRGYTLALLSGDGICGRWRNRICGMSRIFQVGGIRGIMPTGLVQRKD
jgi:hypothetical protein